MFVNPAWYNYFQMESSFEYYSSTVVRSHCPWHYRLFLCLSPPLRQFSAALTLSLGMLKIIESSKYSFSHIIYHYNGHGYKFCSFVCCWTHVMKTQCNAMYQIWTTFIVQHTKNLGLYIISQSYSLSDSNNFSSWMLACRYVGLVQ